MTRLLGSNCSCTEITSNNRNIPFESLLFPLTLTSHLRPSTHRNVVVINLNHELNFAAVVVLMQVHRADLVVHDMQRITQMNPQLPEMGTGVLLNLQLIYFFVA
jgi:hypothetical protein